MAYMQLLTKHFSNMQHKAYKSVHSGSAHILFAYTAHHAAVEILSMSRRIQKDLTTTLPGTAIPK